MKKSILAIAVLAATTMAATAAVAAPTVYGNVHIDIHQFDKSDGTGAGTNGDIDMASQTSSIGVKGSEDIGDGLKVIYKLEFQVDVADSGTGDGGAVGLVNRDQFVGLKGGWGTLKGGTFSSNYKQMGGKVDALYRTALEGRGFMHTQSQLHNGRAFNRGRMTNALSYTTPKMAGFSLVANTTFSDRNDETNGVGLRWSNKAFLAYVDWIDTIPSGANTPVPNTSTESAVKIGGKFSGKAWFVGAQYEDSEDVVGENFIHANGGWNINKNNALILTLGQAEDKNFSVLDTQTVAVAYNHKLSKMTNVYVGYGDRSSDTAAREDSVWALGIRKKF